MWPSLTPEEQQLSGEFCLVQMLRTGTTTIVDAHGYGPVWWLGNPPTDEELLAETPFSEARILSVSSVTGDGLRQRPRAGQN